MQGVITRAQVLAHPLIIAESFGAKVLVRAVFSGRRETFLDIVSRAAEEDEHLGMDAIDLARTVKRYIGFECRARDVYRRLSHQLSAHRAAARFFSTLVMHEEGHAIVLSRVRREIGKGRLWKDSRELHVATEKCFVAMLEECEAEVRHGVTLERALELVERIEASEINVVFDTLNGCVDMRSRGRFERFFVLTQRHLAYCREQIAVLRGRDGSRQSAIRDARLV